jgi:hypothetical protein
MLIMGIPCGPKKLKLSHEKKFEIVPWIDPDPAGHGSKCTKTNDCQSQPEAGDLLLPYQRTMPDRSIH